MYTPQETPVSIYTPSGHLEKLQRITGSTRIDLQAGVYFVRIDGKTYKVVIR
ncbi:T9SS type A sorting domain-containing protein [uncultured Parabacteroides sp.]|uniref:T9SS type A sorting domain-containing protein n=1 Tax=uncultured Parabacteroides sp. TaxID=512312 RepID=UPI00350E516B